MNITAIAAMSLNGLITNGNDADVRKWTSEEDKLTYRLIKDSFKLIVVGGNTFETMLETFELVDGVTVIVLSSNPQKFGLWQQKVEFSTLPPTELVAELEKRGFEEMLLIGGSFAYNSFLDAGLIDEFIITIEPVVFSSGTPLFNSKNRHDFRLKSSEKLNEKGSLLLKYQKETL